MDATATPYGYDPVTNTASGGCVTPAWPEIYRQAAAHATRLGKPLPRWVGGGVVPADPRGPAVPFTSGCIPPLPTVDGMAGCPPGYRRRPGFRCCPEGSGLGDSGAGGVSGGAVAAVLVVLAIGALGYYGIRKLA